MCGVTQATQICHSENRHIFAGQLSRSKAWVSLRPRDTFMPPQQNLWVTGGSGK